MSLWTTNIRAYFVNLLEVTFADLEDIHNRFKETPSGLIIRTMPHTIFNGCYSLNMAGLTRIDRNVSPALAGFHYQIRLEIGFVMNLNQVTNPDTLETETGKTSYNNAIDDLELLVRTILAQDQSSNGFFLAFVPNMTLEPIDSNQEYWIATLQFVANGDVTT